jgi:hypothetical protein
MELEGPTQIHQWQGTDLIGTIDKDRLQKLTILVIHSQIVVVWFLIRKAARGG